MQVSQMCKMIEIWLGHKLFSFRIIGIKPIANAGYRFFFLEYQGTLIDHIDVYPDGRMINANGDDIIDIELSATNGNSEVVNDIALYRDQLQVANM